MQFSQVRCCTRMQLLQQEGSYGGVSLSCTLATWWMNELMDLPIFHDRHSSDKQIQIKTMHNYYSVYSIQWYKSESCRIEKFGIALERSSEGGVEWFLLASTMLSCQMCQPAALHIWNPLPANSAGPTHRQRGLVRNEAERFCSA